MEEALDGGGGVEEPRRPLRQLAFRSPSASGADPVSEDGPSAPASAASSDPDRPQRTRLKPMPRKGHTKSRRGCFNCKRRKVKCQETRPACGHCRRIGLACEYPKGLPEVEAEAEAEAKACDSWHDAVGTGTNTATTTSGASSPTPAPTCALQSTPTMFSLCDLRFFQHFLLTAYPPVPIRGEAIWKDVAVISHHFDYLIHAMLGLGASHLSLLTGEDLSPAALAHRLAAIKALNRSFAKPCASPAEVDARLATMLALAFQSSYMEEGMLEFLSMVRGCGVLSRECMPRFERESLFRAFTSEGHLATVRQLEWADSRRRRGSGTSSGKEEGGQGRGSSRDDLVPCPDDDERDEDEAAAVDVYVASLKSLRPLCSTPLEKNFLAIIERAVELSRTSSLSAYAECCHLYALIKDGPHDEFVALVSPANPAAQLLLAHAFLLEGVVGARALGPRLADRAFPFRPRLVRAWLARVAANVPPRYRGYMTGALEFAGRSAVFRGDGGGGGGGKKARGGVS